MSLLESFQFISGVIESIENAQSLIFGWEDSSDEELPQPHAAKRRRFEYTPPFARSEDSAMVALTARSTKGRKYR